MERRAIFLFSEWKESKIFFFFFFFFLRLRRGREGS